MEAVQKKNKYEIDMCNGTIMDKLISFALPLMVSSILQLLFNAVDIIVVGRFTGSQALAAVGSTTALINMFVNLFIGVSLGANVLSARFYAAGKEREMSETVHTAMTFALISGIVMVFVGLFCARGALELMDTPTDVIDQAALYMKIYFCGMPFFMLYNYGAATKSVSGHCLFHGSGRCGHRYGVLADHLLCAGAGMSVWHGQLLPPADHKAGNQMGVSGADLPGGSACRNSERGDQFF